MKIAQLLILKMLLLASYCYSGQYDIAIYNEEYFSKESCRKFELSNQSCFSMPTNSPHMKYVSSKVQEGIAKRLPSDFKIKNTRRGGSKAENVQDARDNDHGLYLGLSAYPIKMGSYWRLYLSGDMMNTWSGRKYASSVVAYDIPKNADCDDPNAEYGFKKECFIKFFDKAADTLAFALTTKMGINKLDERVQFTHLNAIAETIGRSPGDINTSSFILDNDRYSEQVKEFDYLFNNANSSGNSAKAIEN